MVVLLVNAFILKFGCHPNFNKLCWTRQALEIVVILDTVHQMSLNFYSRLENSGWVYFWSNRGKEIKGWKWSFVLALVCVVSILAAFVSKMPTFFFIKTKIKWNDALSYHINWCHTSCSKQQFTSFKKKPGSITLCLLLPFYM